MKYSDLKQFLVEGNQLYPWQPGGQYNQGTYCLGSDGKIYQALATNQDQDPTTSPDAWQAWVEDLEPNKQSIQYNKTTNASGQAVINLTDNGTPEGNPIFTEAPYINLSVKQAGAISLASMAVANYTLSSDLKTLTIYTATAAAFVAVEVDVFIKEA